ncbi:MAG: hypothetical protein AB7E47_13065 [Desulfovibrionaceae bacterium]
MLYERHDTRSRIIRTMLALCVAIVLAVALTVATASFAGPAPSSVPAATPHGTDRTLAPRGFPGLPH